MLTAMRKLSALCFPELCGATSGVGRVAMPNTPPDLAAWPAFPFCILPQKSQLRDRNFKFLGFYFACLLFYLYQTI